jgi:aspartate kinase
MQIYKFGGASLKKADSLNNIIQIISAKDSLVIVVSAIDKTTNKLETLVDAAIKNDKSHIEVFNQIKAFHLDFARLAFGSEFSNYSAGLNKLLDSLETIINFPKTESYDETYDEIVCYGELLSSYILSSYLSIHNRPNILIDIRDCIVTDSNFRDAKILWQESEQSIRKPFEAKRLYITQGFIGK